MHAKSPKLLADIARHARFITAACAGKSAADYDAEEMLRLSVKRSFEIIGEALNRLLRCDLPSAAAISHTSDIIGFRNILAHGYDIVDTSKVWDVIQRDLPILLKEVEALSRN